MKVLVTGGMGMLGTSLQKVKDIIDDQTKEYIFLSRNHGDLRNEVDVDKIFNLHKPNIVIHLASHVGGVYDNLNNNYTYLIDNTKIHTNILNACKKYNIDKLINILSTCIFPDKEVTYPLTSEQLHNGLPHYSNIGYAFSKRFLQIGSGILSNSSNTQIINIIPTNLYGEHDNYNLNASHVLPALIHKTYLAKKNNTPLYIKGTGSAFRQFLYIDDLSTLIIKFIDYDTSYKEINCIASPSESDEIQIREIVKKITTLFNFNGEVVYDNNYSDGQIKKTTTDKEILKYFNDFNFTSLDIGLKNTIEYFIKYYDFLRK